MMTPDDVAIEPPTMQAVEINIPLDAWSDKNTAHNKSGVGLEAQDSPTVQSGSICGAADKQTGVEPMGNVAAAERTFGVGSGAPTPPTTDPNSQFAGNDIRTFKYPWALFLFMNLFEQFQRIANVYFLIIAIVACTPVSPQNPLTSISPLVLVLAFQGTKDAIEDWKRHQADDITNGSTSLVLRDGAFVSVRWDAIVVGDIVQLADGDAVPADIILTATQSLEKVDVDAAPTGIVHINTKELDGESNLKKFEAKPETRSYCTAERLSQLQCTVRCSPPNKDLYTFVGTLTLDESQKLALTAKQVLLRGTIVKQTYRAWGIVVYTGAETKIMKNNDDEPPLKFSSMEQEINMQLFALFILLFVCCVSGAIGMGVFVQNDGTDGYGDHWYLWLTNNDLEVFGVGQFDPAKAPIVGVFGFFTHLVGFSTLIPISLYVTLEFIKLISGLYIDWDADMWCEELQLSAKCRNSKIVEQLGQVQYVLSDKTGTLTQNKMELLKCSIGGVQYGSGQTEIEQFQMELARQTATDEDTECADSKVEALSKPQEVADREEAGFCLYDPGLNWIERDGQWVFGYLGQPHEEQVREYLLCLVLCNTVLVEVRDEGEIRYGPESPDDGALVKACKNLGIVLKSRKSVAGDREEMVVDVARLDAQGKMKFVSEVYTVLNKIDFTSTRKRMSLVIEMPDGSIRLMVKGADNVVKDRLADQMDFIESLGRMKQAMMPTDDDIALDGVTVSELQSEEDHESAVSELQDKESLRFLARTQGHIDYFANSGLRTLMVAWRPVERQMWAPWAAQVKQANEILDLEEQTKVIDVLNNTMETRLLCLGATAIEDKLQRNVGRTLHNMKRAGINTWVLTGDKTETAKQIGYACNLLKVGQTIHTVGSKDSDGMPISGEQVAAMLAECADKDLRQGTADPALLIEGDALKALGIGDDLPDDLDERSQTKWFEQRDVWQKALTSYCKHVSAVVCCRVSPKQKAEVTKLVKRHLHKCTLGIGDGANDVGMIKAAHVGIGVQGVEGVQAVNNSDFSICEFQHLEILLLTHGRWTYNRIAKVVCYFFYKNIAFTMSMFWWNFYCAFSGQLFYEEWSQICFNVFFTSLPVLALGFFDIDTRLARVCPTLYIPGQMGQGLNTKVFLLWVAEGLYCSIVFFFGWIFIAAFQASYDSPGHMAGFWDLSTMLYTIVILTVTIRIALETSNFTIVTYVFYIGSIVVWFLWLVICSSTVEGGFSYIGVYSNGQGASIYWVLYNYGSGLFMWISMLLIPAACVLPAYCIKSYYAFFPTDLELVRNVDHWQRLLDQDLVTRDKFAEMKATYAIARRDGCCGSVVQEGV